MPRSIFMELNVFLCRDVEESFKVANTFFKRWQELLRSSPQVEEFEWTTAELRKKLKSIEWDLEDLSETINILSNVSLVCVDAAFVW